MMRRRHPVRRPAALGALAGMLLLVGAADASAAQVFERDGTLYFYAKAGETNALDIRDFTVYPSPEFQDGLRVTDPGAGLVAGEGCEPAADGSGALECDRSVFAVRVLAGDGDDAVKVSFAGDVTVYGGTGDDTLDVPNGELGGGAVKIAGESGNDTISATNATLTLLGGTGNDTITARDPLALDVDAGDGNDTLSIASPDGTPISSQAVQMGAGVDTITVDESEFRDYRQTAYGEFLGMSFGPYAQGERTLDGGPGSDTVVARVGFGSGMFDLRLASSIERLTMPGTIFTDNENGYASLLIGDNDPNRLEGGDGNDVVVPNGGADTVYAGGGDDRIVAGKDGVRDDLVCGAGFDTVTAEALDKLWNCESASRLR